METLYICRVSRLIPWIDKSVDFNNIKPVNVKVNTYNENSINLLLDDSKLSLIKPIWKLELRLITATIEETIKKIATLLNNHEKSTLKKGKEIFTFVYTP